MGRGGIIWPETRGSEREREKRSRRARKSADEPYLLHPRSPPFSLLSLFPLVPPPPRSFIEHLVCVCACTIVWEQVRRRLKGRQPGGRRRSKGFRLVPATRRGGEEKNGVRRRRSSASRSGTEMRRARGRIKRDTRGRRDDPMQRVREEGGCAVIARLEYRIVPRQQPGRRHPGNLVLVLVLGAAWMEDRPLGCSERKKEKSGYGLMFFDAARGDDMKSARRLGRKVRETR